MILTTLLTATCIIMYFRIQYLRGYIIGQRQVIKNQKQLLDQRGTLIGLQADFIEQQAEYIDCLNGNDIDAQGIVNKILNQ